jgi:exosortase O
MTPGPKLQALALPSPGAWVIVALVAARRQRVMRGLMLLVWAWSHEAALRWTLFGLAQPSHVVQRFILIGLVALALFDFFAQPVSARVHPRAVSIALTGLLLDSAVRLYSSVQFVHMASGLLLLYALCACFMDAQAWRKRVVLLATLVLCLPIQPHVDAHLGLPLRLWTAQAVAPLLELLGVRNVTVESIIVTENGVADVANACSGVRTLWYAVALWLGARLMWPHTSTRRWWLAGILSVAMAVGLNALRVTTLVLALHHQAPVLLAEMAHASLGLLALAGVGTLNLFLSRSTDPATSTKTATETVAAVSWPVQILLAALMLATAQLPPPARTLVAASTLQTLRWSPALNTSPLPLSEQESSLILGHDATVAEKQRFNFHGVEGSLLVVRSGNWRAHHAPELCLLAQGAHLEGMHKVITSNGTFRVMTLQGGMQSAITWFQSDARVLPDLGARWWSQLLRPQEQWSLITVVVDQTLTPIATLQLHRAVHTVVSTSPKNPS